MQYKKKRSGFKPGRFCVLICKNFALHRGIFCRTGARAVPTDCVIRMTFCRGEVPPLARVITITSKRIPGKGTPAPHILSSRIHRALARAGEPPARVPHDKTVRRTVLPPFLRFLQGRNFALCAGRPKALPLDSTTFEKVDETLNIGAFAVVGARFHPRPNDCIEEDTGQKM